MHSLYSIYGLRLWANMPIPGLIPSSVADGTDVEVWLQSLPPTLNNLSEAASEVWYTSPYQDESGKPTLRVWKLEGGSYFRMRYSDGVEFILDRRGSRIWSFWPDTSTLEDAAVYLLGPVLGFVLRLRGTTCLHASSICIGNQAIAIVGPAGVGKSTTAASFARLGYPVLSDDVVALSEQRGDFLVEPAYPSLRLWPESVKILYGAANALPRLVPGDSSWDKRYLNLTENDYKFQQQPLPLAAVYLLSERREHPAAPVIEEAATSDGLVTLVANTYANYLLDRAMRAKEFKSLSLLVNRIPLRRAIPHADPAHLSRLCDVILDDYYLLNRSAGIVPAQERIALHQ